MLFMSFLIHLSSCDQFFYCSDHDVGVAVATTTVAAVTLFCSFSMHLTLTGVSFFCSSTRAPANLTCIRFASFRDHYYYMLYSEIVPVWDYVLHLKTIIIILFCFMFGTCLNADIWWDYYIACCLLAWCFRQHTPTARCSRVRECEWLSGVVGTLVLLCSIE